MDVLSWQFFVIVVAGISGIAVIFMVIFEGIEKKRMGAIAARIKCSADPKNGYRITGTYKNEGIEIFKVVSIHQHIPTRLEIQFIKNIPFEFKIFRYDLVNSLINSDMEIGIPDFDKKYIIKTTDKIKPATYLQNPEVRRAIETMFARGCDDISFERDRLCLWMTRPTKEEYNPDNIAYILDKGTVLLSNL